MHANAWRVISNSGIITPFWYKTNNQKNDALILNFLANLEDNGIKRVEIRNINWTIAHLGKSNDLTNTEQVQKFIAKKEGKNTYKRRFCYIYQKFCNYQKIDWKAPTYTRDSQEIKVPTHEKIEMIIANSGRTLSLKLKISMETGLRPIELHTLQVKDYDSSQKMLYPKTAKHGAPRKIKISEQINILLQNYIIKEKRQSNDTIFKSNPRAYGEQYREVRNRLAKKLNDESIHQIRLYDLRHYKGTTEYQKTHDLKHVQYILGHKHSSTTDIYIHLSDDEQKKNTHAK